MLDMLEHVCLFVLVFVFIVDCILLKDQLDKKDFLKEKKRKKELIINYSQVTQLCMCI